MIDFLLRRVRLFLDLIAAIIGAIFYPSKLHYLPPITDKLLLEPAVKLAEQIKSGKLKSEDLVQAYIERCKKINAKLNAVVDDNYEEALKEARQIDKRVQRELSGEKPSNEKSIHEYPFLGVPFTTKNSISVEGKTFSGGVYNRRFILAEKDATVIERMKNIGGAIFLAVTNVPELVIWYDSFNKVDGQTNNPYDQSRVSGGSSGGEGALISAAGSIFGVGSDIGGSIRIPSHFCGIFGHKTSAKTIGIEGIYPTFAEVRKKLLSLGPMCRYSCDIRPMLKVLVGDQIDLPEKPLNYSNLNVYYMYKIDDPIASPLNNDIRQGLDKVIKHFVKKGSKTFQLDTDKQFYDFRYAFLLWLAGLYDKNQTSYYSLLSEGESSGINPYVELIKCMFGINKKYTSSALTVVILEQIIVLSEENNIYIQMIERLKRDLHKLLGTNGVLLCSTFPDIAPKHNQTLLKASNVIYTSLWNVLDVAITTVPLGLDRNGLPFSVQVIASPLNDNLSIQVAEELEHQFGGWVPPCSVQIKNSNQ